MTMMGIALFFWDRNVPVWVAASVGLGILMVGFWVVIIKSWRAGLFAAYREQVNSKATTRRKMLRRLIVTTLFFGISGFLCDYYLISDIDGELHSIGRSLLFAMPEMIFWGACMYWLQMRKLRKENENQPRQRLRILSTLVYRRADRAGFSFSCVTATNSKKDPRQARVTVGLHVGRTCDAR